MENHIWIEELLEKYFEGNTSAAEEKELRVFFSSKEVPAHLEVYRPLFIYFNEEIEKERESESEKVIPFVKTSNPRRVLYWVSGIAASIFILLGIGRLWVFPGTTFCSDNYIVINGRCYTDKQMIKTHVLEALNEISSQEEDLLPFLGEEGFEHEIIQNQLRELGDLFNEE